MVIRGGLAVVVDTGGALALLAKTCNFRRSAARRPRMPCTTEAKSEQCITKGVLTEGLTLKDRLTVIRIN